jgi:hypothetical protein
MAGADSETQPMNAGPFCPPEPRPDRYRWTRRGLKLAGSLVVLLAGLRWWWGYEANRRLQAEIAGYRAAGQLVYAHEFDAQFDAIPDAENAAVLYEQAMNNLLWPLPSGVSIEEFYENPATINEKPDDATELITAHQLALNLVREARSRPQCAWSEHPGSLTGQGWWTLGSNQRALAKLLRVTAEYHYRIGDPAEAMRTTHDLIVYSDAVAANPMLISTLVGYACRDLAFDFMEDVGAWADDAGDPGFAAWSESMKKRSELEALLAGLLDEQRQSETGVATLFGERAFALDRLSPGGPGSYFGTLPPSSIWDRIVAFTTKPVYVLDAVREMQLCTAASLAVQDDSWLTAQKNFAASDVSPSFLRMLSHPITLNPYGSSPTTIRGFLKTHYKHLARRRMGVTALAIHFFRLDHGRRPDSLDELVPRYLPVVPLDPFAPDGATIRYRPDTTPALLYSVGVDGTDNNGERLILEDKRVDATCSDIPFRLGD